MVSDSFGTRPLDESKLTQASEILYANFASPAAYQLYPDAVTFLEELSRKRDRSRLRVGAISNTDKRVVRLLTLMGLARHLDFVTFEEEAKCGKPEKAIFDLAVKRSGLDESDLDPRQILHIGDDLVNDYEAPREINWQALLLDRNGGLHHEVTTRAERSDLCKDFAEVATKLQL